MWDTDAAINCKQSNGKLCANKQQIIEYKRWSNECNYSRKQKLREIRLCINNTDVVLQYFNIENTSCWSFCNAVLFSPLGLCNLNFFQKQYGCILFLTQNDYKNM